MINSKTQHNFDSNVKHRFNTLNFIKEEFELFNRFPHQEDSQSFLIIIINIISGNI